MERLFFPPSGLLTLNLEGDAPFADALLKEDGDGARHRHPEVLKEVFSLFFGV
jgi:hypothetical protein